VPGSDAQVLRVESNVLDRGCEHVRPSTDSLDTRPSWLVGGPREVDENPFVTVESEQGVVTTATLRHSVRALVFAPPACSMTRVPLASGMLGHSPNSCWRERSSAGGPACAWRARGARASRGRPRIRAGSKASDLQRWFESARCSQRWPP
jgi:hypothetical protein